MNLEKGNWPAQDTKNIVASVRRVFEKRSIEQLSKKSYEHIIAHMGFIAHYSRAGFMDTYRDLADFAEKLLTSEYSRDTNKNDRDADRYTRDDWFIRKYGKNYCQSVTDSNVGIVNLAKIHLSALQQERDKAIENAERAQLAKLQAKYV